MRMTTAFALLLKPFVILVFFALVLIPARLAVMRFMPDGKLKRLLLTRVDGRDTHDSGPAQVRRHASR